MMISQTMNGLLLPVILIAMLALINDRRLMHNYINGWGFNLLAWATVVILIILAAILLVTTFFPGVVRLLGV
jgi:Mn2+/Fe2+ NRAMP family transporter